MRFSCTPTSRGRGWPWLLIFAAACTQSVHFVNRQEPAPSSDAGPDAMPVTTTDSGELMHDAWPDTEVILEAGQAQPSPSLSVHPRVGAQVDDPRAPFGPGLVLDGGYNGARMMRWVHHTCSNDQAARGDVVVLSAAGVEFSAEWLAAAPFHSAQSISLGAAATAADFGIVADIVGHAEVIYFAGGDQAAYVRWAGTPLMAAVQAVYDRGGVVSGSSAGMIILGASVNDALVTLSENITTQVALADPYDARMHFTQNIFHFAPLARSITDPHFSGRDRMGRLVTFMARQIQDGFAAPDILGIGVDDGAALVIGPDGIGLVLADSGTPAAFVVQGATPTHAQAGAPLVYDGLVVAKLTTADGTYNFAKRCADATTSTLQVDGRVQPPYADAYATRATRSACH